VSGHSAARAQPANALAGVAVSSGMAEPVRTASEHTPGEHAASAPPAERTDRERRDERAAPTTPTAAARCLLDACRGGDTPAARSPEPHLAALAAFDDDALAPVRTDRATALAFWCNCYNAGTQRLLAERPALYDSPLRSVRFFRAPAVTVGGTPLSLDTIEHGILRSRTKYGLGYLPRFLVGSFEHRYRLADPDPRVHFALNCGAASCPAIRAYDPANIDAQLDLATRSYLDESVTYDPDAGTVELPQLFRWYRGDFGGPRGIRALLREYDVVPEGARPTLRYRSWDWSKAPRKFVE